MIAIGPYEQRDVGGMMAWCPPPSALGAIDLRSLSRQNDPGVCVVEIPSPVDGFEPVGQSWDEVISGRSLLSWRAKTGALVAAGTVADVLWQTLTTESDPTGQDRQKPLMPTRRRHMDLHCNGRVRRAVWRPDMPEAAPTIDLMRREYRETRQATLEGRYPEGHYRRVLDYWADKLGIERPEELLIPSDLPRETRLRHATTLTESFNRADASGWGPDQTWTAFIGSAVETVSNRGRVQASAGIVALYADATLSGSDMYTQCALHFGTHSSGDYMGMIARKAASGTATHYFARHFNTNSGQTFKVVSGAFTAIGTNTTSASMSSGLVSRLECDGSSIIRIYNGTTEDTATDTTITGNTYGGAYCRRATGTLHYEIDDWEAGDLAAGGSTVPVLYYHLQQQGIS